jgi:predicted phage terminase large subunit-like protein
MSTRLNDPKTGAYIVIMQRLHESDLTGHILSKDKGDWTHLCLPMRMETDRRCITQWFVDDREEGELLIEDRFGETEVKGLEIALGPSAAAGQLQQRPVPKGGGIFKRDWWVLWDETISGAEGMPKTVFPAFDYIVASLDTAYTTRQENDYSAMTIWGVWTDRQNNRRIMLVYAWQDRLEFPQLTKEVAALCVKFKVDRLLIESKAAGISVAQELRTQFSREDWGIQLVDPGRGDKVARAYSVQHLFADKMIYAPDYEWAEKLITQSESFPKAAHDDLVDSMTQALIHLRTIGFAQKPAEIVADRTDTMLYKPSRPQPLYPV